MNGAKLSFDLSLQRPKGGFRLAAKGELMLAGLTAIIGPSGCGKTTLLRALAGLEPAAEGLVQVDQSYWQEASGAGRVPPEKRAIGMVFQEARLFPHLRVKANLLYAQKRRHGHHGPSFAEVCRWVGIEHLLSHRISQLSGGEKQRVAIARALLNGPRLLLMDEPLAALDPVARLELESLISRLPAHYGIPVVMVSHSMATVGRIADQVVLMKQGQVERIGSWQNLFSALDVSLVEQGEAAAVLEGEVLGDDDSYPLTRLGVAGQTLIIPKTSAAIGSRMRLRVPAHDVVLVADPASETSMLNRLAVTVDSVRELANQQVLVKLRVGEQYLLSAITCRSVHALKVSPGRQLGAQFKTTALTHD